jgi:hypothetical protein
MTPREIFEAWAQMNCQDYLTKQLSSAHGFSDAKKLEPQPSMWNTYTLEDNEIDEKDLDIVKEYSQAFESLENSAEEAIADLAYMVTRGLNLYDLLEDVFYEYLPKEYYTKFHKIVDDINEIGTYTKGELKNLKVLSKSKEGRPTFLAILGL